MEKDSALIKESLSLKASMKNNKVLLEERDKIHLRMREAVRTKMSQAFKNKGQERIRLKMIQAFRNWFVISAE